MKNHTFLIYSIVCIGIVACKKSDTVPGLSTINVTSITETTAISGGNIASGSSITSRGVCWSTSPNPTIANSITTTGSGTGRFTSNITGLIPNTTYYLRAFATNSEGTGYGNVVSFKTAKGGLNVNGIINALIEYNGNLIAGGVFDSAGGNPVSGIAQWNGSSWTAMGAGFSEQFLKDGEINSLIVFNGILIAGGQFTNTGGNPINYIAQWNGSTWDPLGSGVNGGVLSSIVYNNNLIVGGNFTTAGGNSANYIAQWNGSSWSNLGSGVTGVRNDVLSLTVYNANQELKTL